MYFVFIINNKMLLKLLIFSIFFLLNFNLIFSQSSEKLDFYYDEAKGILIYKGIQFIRGDYIVKNSREYLNLILLNESSSIITTNHTECEEKIALTSGQLALYSIILVGKIFLNKLSFFLPEFFLD
jgi:hypothetical protein